MALPANELTRGDFRNWIVKEGPDGAAHLIVPSADQAYQQYDMCVSLPWCGIVDPGLVGNPSGGVVAGDEFSMHVAEGIQIDSREIEDGAVFNTFGQEVWYNAVTKQYTDTEDEGLYLVGYVVLPTDSYGCFRFEKRRYVVEGEAS